MVLTLVFLWTLISVKRGLFSITGVGYGFVVRHLVPSAEIKDPGWDKGFFSGYIHSECVRIRALPSFILGSRRISHMTALQYILRNPRIVESTRYTPIGIGALCIV